MQRRTFLQTAGFLPVIGLYPGNEIRSSVSVDESTLVNMIVRSHATGGVAERHRRSWVGRVFENPYGEWYDVESEFRELPAHLARLPGSLSFHKTLFGEAAEEHSYLSAAFRREHISCVVRMQMDNEALMIRIAEHIASQPSPSLFETSWSSAQLRSFLPDSNDLNLSVEPCEIFFP